MAILRMLTNMVMLSPSRVRSRVSQMNEERPPHVTCPDHSFYFHGLFRSKALLCTLYHCLLTRFSLKTFFFKCTIQKNTWTKWHFKMCWENFTLPPRNSACLELTHNYPYLWMKKNEINCRTSKIIQKPQNPMSCATKNTNQMFFSPISQVTLAPPLVTTALSPSRNFPDP